MSTQEGSHWPPLPSFTFLLLVHAVPCKLHIQSVVLFTIPITEEFLVHQMSNKYSDVQMTDFTANWNISRPQAAVVSPGNWPDSIIHYNHQGRVTLVESSCKSFHGIYKLAICCCHTTLRWIFPWIIFIDCSRALIFYSLSILALPTSQPPEKFSYTKIPTPYSILFEVLRKI